MRRQTPRAPAHMPAYAGPHDASLRNGFLRKVFGILLAQIALTAYVSLRTLAAGQGRVDAARAAHFVLDTNLCEDRSCGQNGKFTNDGECDDGGVGALHSVCAFGTDCTDCGAREAGTEIPVVAAAVAAGPYLPWFAALFVASFCLTSVRARTTTRR